MTLKPVVCYAWEKDGEEYTYCFYGSLGSRALRIVAEYGTFKLGECYYFSIGTREEMTE